MYLDYLGVGPAGKMYILIILIVPEESTAGRNKVHALWRELPVKYIKIQYLLF